MYKVFFNDRPLFLTDEYSKNFQVRHGLFYKFKQKEDLLQIINVYLNTSSISPLTLYHYDIEELQEVFRSCFKVIDAAGGIVKNEDKDFLFIYRRNRWDLPKGKVDSGENYQQAALREVKEETGLKEIYLNKPLMSTYHVYPYKGELALKKTFWFEMNLKGTQTPIPQTEEDITDIKWVNESNFNPVISNTFPLVRDLFMYLGVLKNTDIFI